MRCLVPLLVLAVRASLFPVALSVPCPADVLVVDANGGADFDTITAAVGAAGPGDLIYVWPGDYDSFTVVSKELSVVGFSGLVRVGGVQVQHLTENQQVLLANLEVQEKSPAYESLIVTDCAGPVRLQNCLFVGWNGPCLVDGSASDVVLVQSEILGGGAQNGHGLQSLRQLGGRVALYDSQLEGGHGAPGEDAAMCFGGACTDGEPAGPAWQLGSGSAGYAVRSRLVGGIGGRGGETPCETCYDGADGSAVAVGPGSRVTLVRSFTDGLVQGTVRRRPAEVMGLELQTVALEGRPVRVRVAGTPGDEVRLLLSTTACFEDDLLPHGVQGVLHVWPPWQVLELGPLDEGGQLVAEVELPKLPDGLSNLALHAQALGVTPAGTKVLSNPGFVHVVGEGTFPDADGNGVPDDLEIQYFRAQDCNGNGVPDPWDLAAGTSVDEDGNGLPDECESRIYVDAGQTGGGQDGSTWETAFRDLHDGLAAAAADAHPHVSVWVAKGIYRPGPPGGDPSRAFELPDRTRLLGGFFGSEKREDERDPERFSTVLSGDLNGDDGPGFTNRADNAHNVVRAMDVAGGTRLDGFVVRSGGQSWTSGSGGGADVRGAGFAIASCRFEDNIAQIGAGLRWFTLSGDPRPVQVLGCTFVHNVSGSVGGGAYVLTDDYDQYTPHVIVGGCRFVANEVVGGGPGAGLALIEAGGLTLVSCLFHANVVVGSGRGAGAFVDYQGASERRPWRIAGCTFADNECAADWSTAGLWLGYYTQGMYPHLELSSSIFWNNKAAGLTSERSNLRLHTDFGLGLPVRCCIQHLDSFAGNGNFAAPPLFVDPDGADDVPGTLDDDYRLLAGSRCIDSGWSWALPRDSFDLDGDGDRREPWPYDLDGHARRRDDPASPDTSGPPPVLDRGAYERQ